MKLCLHSILGMALVFCLQPMATAADDGKAKAAKGQVVTVKLAPAKGPTAVPASVHLVEQGDRTRVEVSLLRMPGSLANPHIVATIYKGVCSDANKTQAYSFDSGASNPNVVGRTANVGIDFEGIAPMALSMLRSGSYSIGVMTGPAEGNAQLACGDIK